MGKDWVDAYDSDSNLSEVEHDKKLPFFPTWGECKMLLICSVGFFIDAYDLFIINIVVIITNYEYTGKLSGSIPAADAPLRGGLLKAAANIGCVIGQVGFGYFGDFFGRKSVYGKELVVSIIATIMLISVPNYFSARSIFTWLTCWRILLGIGIGGDYPMSAAIVADRSNLRRRGVLLAFIFSFQGWGSFIGSVISIILLAIFKKSIFTNGQTGHFDAIWRILVGLVLVPCFGVIYSRFTMTESAKMRGVQAVREDPSLIMKGTVSGLPRNPGEHTQGSFDKERGNIDPIAAKTEAIELAEQNRGVGKAKKGQSDFAVYFSEWRHAKILIGTTMTWFLLDIIFYGINLNQGIVVTAIGLASSKNPWQFVFDQAKANLIIAAAGFLPGYYFFMALVEYTGRKPLLIGGFIFNALFFGILAGDFNGLRTKSGAFIAVFTLLQLSFNFGANTATFVIPAEVFPTRVRGTAHGLSAACGKVGAIIASLGFAEAQAHIGTANVLWIFFGIAVLGIPFSFLIPETKGRDADVVDLQERQAALGLGHAAL